MSSRKGIYFAFQGLLMAVLLLLFLYEYRTAEGWLPRFAFLLAALAGTLWAARRAPPVWLFVFDAGLVALTLTWTHRASSLYLLFLLIVFGTALTRRWTHSLVVTVVSSVLYLISSGRPDEAFWLRLLFLWVVSSLCAILAHDSQEEELRHRERTVQYERLAAIGQLAAEVAHRIKGPLTTIKVNAEVLSHKDARPELTQIIEETDRCKDILKNLLNLGRIEEMDLSPLDLREPVKLAVESIEARFKKFGIKVKLEAPAGPVAVLGDQSLLQEAVSALLHNAAEAKPKRVSVRASAARGWAAVEVEDDGRGVRRADLEKIFTPFFTTKGPEGSGLGLSAALRIMQKHGGTVEAYSEGPGRGSLFRLTVPLA